MFLTRYGLRVWLPILLAGAALVVLLAVFRLLWEAAVVGVACAVLLSFFRDPVRRIAADLEPGAMLSPADGTVSAVLDLLHHEATGGPAKLIRIFLSVLNVHVNRSPCDGDVVDIKAVPGKFLNAQRADSADVNESNLIVMRIDWSTWRPGGRGASDARAVAGPDDRADSYETLGVRQVAGMLARAIVCPLQVGDRLKRGQRFGMIKFGSTTELILPRPGDVTVHVRKGQKVRGGKTVIATLAPAQRPPADATSRPAHIAQESA